MRSFWVILIAFFFQYNLHGQAPSIDSLKAAFLQERNDSARIDLHLKYIEQLLKDRKMTSVAEKEISMLEGDASLKSYLTFRPWLFYYKATVMLYKTEYIKCIIMLDEAKRMLQTQPESDKKIRCSVKIYLLAGLAYSSLIDWENSQLNYQKAIEYAKRQQDSSSISRAYLRLAFVFINYQDWFNASINLHKSLDHITLGDSKENLVTLFSTLANAYRSLNKPQEAWKYILKSDSVLKLEKTAKASMFNSLCRGEYFYYEKQYQKALEYGPLSLHYAREYGDSVFTAVALEQNARFYRAVKDYSMADFYIKSSISIADRYNYLGVSNIAYYEQMLLYGEMGRYKEAFEISSKLIMLTDSLARVMNNNRRIINDAAFESEQKEKKIVVLTGENQVQQLKLKQKNILNYILIGSGVTLLIISLLSYRNFKQKQKLQQLRINELETEKQLAATDAVLKGEAQERTRLAKDLHDGLGGLLSGIKYSFQTMKGNLVMTPDNQRAFERSMDMLDSSIQEMRRVAHNMMPEALVKFGLDTALKDFCNDINLSGALQVNYQSIGMETAKVDQTTAITIYRIVQELIHNTMKHAAAKSAIVQLSKDDQRINITVEDDGKGFDSGVIQQASGIGWRNIQSRIEYLKGNLDVQTAPGKGTSVHIEIRL